MAAFAKKLAKGAGMSDRERERFFSIACDYYIAGRFAAFAGLNPVEWQPAPPRN